MRCRPAIVALAALGFLLAAAYAVVVPPSQGPDELAHLGYVQEVARGRLPVLGSSAQTGLAAYEAHQPPLYYVLCAPVFLATRGLGAPAASLALRLFTALLGVCVICGVTALAWALFPDASALGLGAAAFAALLPAESCAYATINNDCLAELCFTLAMLAAVRRVRVGAGGNAAGAAWLGLWTGLAFLSKASGLLLFAVGPLALLLAHSRPAVPSHPRTPLPPHPPTRALSPPIRDIGLFYLVALAISGPWMVRNLLVTGDPIGWSSFLSFFHDRFPAPRPESFLRMGVTLADYWRHVADWGFRSALFSFPGWGNRTLWLPRWWYRVWGALWALALAGTLRWIARTRDHPVWLSQGLAVLTIVGVLTVSAYVRLNSIFFWAQARYLLPSGGAFAVLWALGLLQLVPKRGAWLLILASTFLLMANVMALSARVAPYYKMNPSPPPAAASMREGPGRRIAAAFMASDPTQSGPHTHTPIIPAPARRP